MEVTITIKYDVVKNQITVENHDELGELEYIGILEMAKLMAVENTK